MQNNTNNLYHKLSRYAPQNDSERNIFDNSVVSSMNVDKDRKWLMITIASDVLFRKKDIYALEQNVRMAYGLNTVEIYTEYPSSMYNDDYIPELLIEASRRGELINGFFDHYEIRYDDESITFAIPFNEGALRILGTANTAEHIGQILKREFSISKEIKITLSEDSEDVFRRHMTQFQEEMIREAKRIYEADRIRRENAPAKSQSKTPGRPEQKSDGKVDLANLTRVESIFEGSETVDMTGNIVAAGKMRFDLAGAVGIDTGKIIPIRTTSVSTRKDITVLGQVFEITSRETKKGDKVSFNIGLTDNDASVYIKTMCKIEDSADITDTFREGGCYAVSGDIKEDKFDGENYISYSKVTEVKKVLREDRSDEKRVELHLHTNMSALDGLSKVDEVIKTAVRWGHKAVAVTDHGNLQSFPTAMLTAEKLEDKIKIIYGMEGYFVDDTQRAAYNGDGISFEDEFVVFDIETTGLSALNNNITEIGAVKFIKGEIKDKYQRFVNPGEHIPEEITKLTGITDEMVAGADDISVVLPDFLSFCGNRMLVAHNANFDTGFIRAASERLGVPFTNPYMDTVAMSHYLNPTLKKHKLDDLADHYGLGDFNHHRASDDAEMLALIFSKMVEQLEDEGIHDISRMNYVMSEKADPLKLHTYHQILLVKNQTGLKNLYKLVSDSYLKYYRRHPRIPKTLLTELRDGLIIGSACCEGELYRAILDGKTESELEEIASFYDYLEIQPDGNNEFLITEGKVRGKEELHEINLRIIRIAEKLGKPVVATSDSHYLDPEDDIYRRILMYGMKFKDSDRENHLYFRTTDEMLEEFSYLGEELCHKVVIDYPNMIADMIEYVRPIPKGNYPPSIEGSEEQLTEKCYSLAKELYGDPLPPQVGDRLKVELDSIIKNGFAVMYIIARKLVENSEAKGYQVGSRGSVGSSFAATMAGITRVNPLPPHYRCPKCKYSDFTEFRSEQPEVKSGFDLAPKNCPVCGEPMERDGHDIPFETFLGFKGDKTPDIDLNFSGDVQADAHKYTEVLFGKGKAFKAGTIGTIAEKTAYGFVVKYLEDKGQMVNKPEINRLLKGCVGIKRTTGQHPGGIIVVPKDFEVYDFCPVQHPADDPNSTIITTHFEFKYLHDTILKLDILGHDIPTKYKRLEEYSNTNILDVPMTDPVLYKIFTSTDPLGVSPKQIFSETGTLGLPEMGTRFIRSVLMDAKPENFADLLQISGLTHGTNVWIGNADELIKNKICTIKDVIGCRDDIMLDLIHKYHMDKSLSFKIMEDVRKGRGLKPEYEAAMIENNVPEWYISSCKKIKYMFPKAHAAAYVMDALRLAWYKIYKPVVFYAAYFTAAPDGFDSEIVMQGRDFVYNQVKNWTAPGTTLSKRESEILSALLLANEFYQRGYKFLPIDYEKSDAHKFVPEGDNAIRLPFDSLSGIGTAAAEVIVSARDSGTVHSVDDLKESNGLSKSVIEVLENNGVLKNLASSNQLDMFSGLF